MRRRGVVSREFTDHTNVRPTLLALLGLRDDYGHDGRVLTSALRSDATPSALRSHSAALRELAADYEQLNASFGDFALTTLKASTTAIKATDDATYDRIENAIAALTARRDALAGRIKAQLGAAAFDGRRVDARLARSEAAQARRIIADAHALARA